MHPDQVQEPLRIQGGAQRTRHQPDVGPQAFLAEQDFDVTDPQSCGRGLESAVAGALRPHHQVTKFHHVGNPLSTEGNQPLQGWCAGAQRGRTEHEAGLECCL